MKYVFCSDIHVYNMKTYVEEKESKNGVTSGYICMLKVHYLSETCLS